MAMIQKYLNPLLPACEEQMKANYGLCALTHWTAYALKIENIALKIISVFLASLFDATIGFGIVCSLSYNSGVVLYNSYGKVKHLYQKYQLGEGKKWNETALKTWAVIGASSALLAGLYYFGAFGAMKNWIWPSSQLPLPGREDLPSQTPALQEKPSGTVLPEAQLPVASTFFGRMWTIFKRDVPYLLTAGAFGGIFYFYRSLPDYRAHEKYKEKYAKAPQCWEAIEFAIQKLKWHPFLRPFLGKEVQGEFLKAEFQNPQIPFLISLYDQCFNRWQSIYDDLRADKRRLRPWLDRKFINAANDAMKVSLALSCLLLEDIRSRGGEKKEFPLEFLNEGRFFYYKYLMDWEEGFLKTYLYTRNFVINGERNPKKEMVDLFFQEGSIQSSWRNSYNQYSTHFGHWADETIEKSNFHRDSLDHAKLLLERMKGGLQQDNNPENLLFLARLRVLL